MFSPTPFALACTTILLFDVAAASAQNLGVIRGRVIDGSGWEAPAAHLWVGLAHNDSILAETQTGEDGTFQFSGPVAAVREIQLFTYPLAQCFHPVRLGAEFMPVESAPTIPITVLPMSRGTDLSDAHCEPTRETDRTIRPVLEKILNQPPLSTRVAPWLSADTVVLRTNKLRLGSSFNLLGRTVQVGHITGGFFGFSNCELSRALPARVRDTITTEEAGPPPACWEQAWITTELWPNQQGGYHGWWSAFKTIGPHQLGPVTDTLTFEVLPDGSGWTVKQNR